MNKTIYTCGLPQEGESNSQYELLHAMPLGVCIFSNDYLIRFWNRCLESWTRLSAAEVLGRDLRVVFPHLAAAKYTSRFETLFHCGPPVIFSAQLHGSIIPSNLSSGAPRLQHSVARSFQPPGGGECCVLLTMQDATEIHTRIRDYSQMRDQALHELEERKRAEDALRESEEKLRSITESALDAIIVINGASRVEFWNPSAERVFGYTEAEAKGKDFTDLLVPEDRREHVRMLMGSFVGTDKGSYTGRLHETVLRRNGGALFPVEFSVASVRVGEGWWAVGTLRDISERKATETRLHELATTDGLTGLSNRRHFVNQVRVEFDRAGRYGVPLSLLMLDADLFKNINDTFGHETGDRALCLLAETIRQRLRVIDSVGRLGGEEFAVLLPETTLEGALQVAERIRSAVERSAIPTDQGQCSLTVSLGVATMTADMHDLGALLRRADAALYAAKNNGRNRVEIDPSACFC
jgi:diguanylate cyclase (GGDEF)-like protein/PAS domain S-box-containing protein